MPASFLSFPARWRWAVRNAVRGIVLTELPMVRRAYHDRQVTMKKPLPSLESYLRSQSVDSQYQDNELVERIVTREAQGLSDPWRLARRVEELLRQSKFDEAALVTKFISKKRQVVVAWNHLINYKLEMQQLAQAIKLFNDMKKRGQLPNAHTYTIIFRGCAQYKHQELAVAEALKLYNTLLQSDRLNANSTHLNAVLNVCAQAGDLDAVFEVASTADDAERPATAFTYTTIWNALRYYYWDKMKDLPSHQRSANRREGIERAKALWAEAMYKWASGRLHIDEEFVCAMGRMLLLAPVRMDKREVLDILAQGMNIPNLTKDDDANPFEDRKMYKVAINGKPPVAACNASYAIPGRNTLSLILTTLASSQESINGIKYWNLLVRHYGVVPDRDNWLRMLGVLKVACASSHAARLLEMIPPDYLNEKACHIAMEACVADNINRKCIENSTKMLNFMVRRLPVPDLVALRHFLRVALVSNLHFRTAALDGDKLAKSAYGIQIVAALTQLWKPFWKVYKHHFQTNSLPGDSITKSLIQDNRREVILLARLMYDALDKVVIERMIPDRESEKLRQLGNRLSSIIQGFRAQPDNEPSHHRYYDNEKPSLADHFRDNRVAGRSFIGTDRVWNTSCFVGYFERPDEHNIAVREKTNSTSRRY